MCRVRTEKNITGVAARVVTDLRPSSVERFALSSFLYLLNPGLAMLCPGLDVLGASQYVEVYLLWGHYPPELKETVICPFVGVRWKWGSVTPPRGLFRAGAFGPEAYNIQVVQELKRRQVNVKVFWWMCIGAACRESAFLLKNHIERRSPFDWMC